MNAQYGVAKWAVVAYPLPRVTNPGPHLDVVATYVGNDLLAFWTLPVHVASPPSSNAQLTELLGSASGSCAIPRRTLFRWINFTCIDCKRPQLRDLCDRQL